MVNESLDPFYRVSHFLPSPRREIIFFFYFEK